MMSLPRVLCFAAALIAPLTLAEAGVSKIERIVITVSDIARTERFFHDGLEFETIGKKTVIDPDHARLLGVKDAHLQILTMRIGSEVVDFAEYDQKGKAYPADSRSPDLWFQHFAGVRGGAGSAVGMFCSPPS